MGVLDPLASFRNATEWTELEVLKCSGHTESPVLRSRWGQREFLSWFSCSGKEQAGAQDLGNYTI